MVVGSGIFDRPGTGKFSVREDTLPAIVGRGFSGSAVKLVAVSSSSSELSAPKTPSGCNRKAVSRAIRIGHSGASRQCPPCISCPPDVFSPPPPPMTNRRTRGSVSTPLSASFSQRSNQRSIMCNRLSARFPRIVAAGPISTSPAIRRSKLGPP